MCVVSEGNERYKARTLPRPSKGAHVVRSLSFFTYASWTPRKEVFWWIQTGVNGGSRS